MADAKGEFGRPFCMREAASLTNGAAVVDWRRDVVGFGFGFGIAFVGADARDVAGWVVGASSRRL